MPHLNDIYSGVTTWGGTQGLDLHTGSQGKLVGVSALPLMLKGESLSCDCLMFDWQGVPGKTLNEADILYSQNVVNSIMSYNKNATDFFSACVSSLSGPIFLTVKQLNAPSLQQDEEDHKWKLHVTSQLLNNMFIKVSNTVRDNWQLNQTTKCLRLPRRFEVL